MVSTLNTISRAYKFHEFKFFTGTISYYQSGTSYQPSFNAQEITTPPQVRTIKNIGIGNGNTRKIIINEGMRRMESGARGTICTLLDVSSTVIEFSPYVGYGLKNLTVIMRPLIPPAKISTSYENQFTPVAIYVPDESFDDYYNSSEWAKWKAKFKPMSEFTG
jgi:hypothetical protein